MRSSANPNFSGGNSSGGDASVTNRYSLVQEETFEQRLARIKQKSGIPPRPPSGGDTRIRKQQTANGLNSRLATGARNGQLSSVQSKPTFKRFNENEYNQPTLAREQSNRLLGNRKAFLNNTNQVTNQDDTVKGHRDTVMSNSTKDNSEVGQNQGPTIEDPHANLELTEEELNEIYSRPYMNPEHAQFGVNPESNRILDAEKALIESKSEKCMELIKQNGEIFAILEQAKTDKHVL